MKLRFHRGPELARETRRLPADLYKRLRRELHLHPEPSLFIAIRSMQYLAIADEEEVVFLDGMGDRHIELAWQNFQPQRCRTVGDPVPYECVYYDEQGRHTMRRLIREFDQALEHLRRRQQVGSVNARVTPLGNRRS